MLVEESFLEAFQMQSREFRISRRGSRHPINWWGFDVRMRNSEGFVELDIYGSRMTACEDRNATNQMRKLKRQRGVRYTQAPHNLPIDIDAHFQPHKRHSPKMPRRGRKEAPMTGKTDTGGTERGAWNREVDNAPSLAEQVAEAMATYAGAVDDTPFMAQAEQLLRSFEAIEGRLPRDYSEIEAGSLAHKHPSGPFLVVK
jgi:hypothetical protein